MPLARSFDSQRTKTAVCAKDVHKQAASCGRCSWRPVASCHWALSHGPFGSMRPRQRSCREAMPSMASLLQCAPNDAWALSAHGAWVAWPGWPGVAAACCRGRAACCTTSPVAGCHRAPQMSQAGGRCMRACTLQAPYEVRPSIELGALGQGRPRASKHNAHGHANRPLRANRMCVRIAICAL